MMKLKPAYLAARLGLRLLSLELVKLKYLK